MKPKLYLLATLGLPGSGKTHFSRRFAKDFKFFHLSSDRIRFEIFVKPKYTLAENKIVFRIMDFLVEDLLSSGISVLYDSNSTKREYRRRLQKIAKKNRAEYSTLWFRTSIDLALSRIAKRNQIKSKNLKKYHPPITEAILLKIKRKIQKPTSELHIAIDSTLSYAAQKKFVQQKLFEK